MKNDESYGLTWSDFFFGLAGSTLFIIILHLFTSL